MAESQPLIVSRLWYSWLPFRDLLAEPDFPAMLEAHWLEGEPHKEACPHNPDFQRYVNLDDAGGYKVWAARDGEQLVGYVGTFINKHMQSQVLTAYSEPYMLLPAYRGHFSSLLLTLQRALADLGVVRWMIEDVADNRHEPIFIRKGFSVIAHTYVKILT